MDQDKIKGQNVQVNIPVANNAPDNPYTTYYNQYIANPNEQKNQTPKSKWLLATIFCAISDILMVGYLGLWGAFIFQLLTGSRDELIDADKFTMVSIWLYIYILIISLALSIVAKAVHRKSIWAVINFILLAVILAAEFIFCPIVTDKAQSNKIDREKTITKELNSDIEDLLKEYSFDVQDFDEDYRYHKDDEYHIWIYVSSEASRKQINEVDKFLEAVYDMDSSREYKITFVVHPVYFEPDNDDRFVFEKTYKFTYEKISGNPEWADIDDHIDVWEYDPRKTSHVPESVEEGQLLIVIR